MSVTSFALDPAINPTTFVRRGSVASNSSRPVAYAHGLLALAALSWREDDRWATRVDLYRVGPSGELVAQPGPTDAPLVHIAAMAFHPSGRFLYVAGVSPGHGSAVDLLTYSVEDDGTLRPFASLLFSPDDTLRADQMVVSAPAP